MKRIILGIIVLFLLSGCTNAQEKEYGDSKISEYGMHSEREENEDMLIDTSEHEIYDESITDDGIRDSELLESTDSSEEFIDREYELSPYIIIRPELQMILKTDGTVWGKGFNEHGELGNGERIDTSDWSKINDLDEVTGIYAFDNFGFRNMDSRVLGHCYALTKNGELYRWGDNILMPEKVTFFPTIKEIIQSTGDLLIIICENGEKYLMYPFYEDVVLSYNSLPDNAKLYRGACDFNR